FTHRTPPRPPTLSLHDALPISQESGDSKQDFISEMNAAGLTNLKIDELIALKTHGVTSQFVREMTAALTKKVTAEEVVAMKIHGDRKSTRLNSSHLGISYAVFC